jgi:hypothetical protein
MKPHYNRQLGVLLGTLRSCNPQAQTILADIGYSAGEWEYIPSSLRAPGTGLCSINDGTLCMLDRNWRRKSSLSRGFLRVEYILEMLN